MWRWQAGRRLRTGGTPRRSVPAATASGSRDSRERGSFTAELATGLPALILLLVAGLTAVNAVTGRAQCLAAAREAALAVARGEPGNTAAQRSAPPGAVVSVTVAGDTVTATVRAPIRPLGGLLPQLTVTASAVAALEPGTAAGEVP